MTTRDLAPPPVALPDDGPPPARSPRRLPRVPLVVLAILAGLVGLAVPLAPVVAAEPAISWPTAGQLPQETLVPLVPYRPRALTADIPCSALRAVADRGGGEVLRTRDARSEPVSLGLVVAVEGGTLRIVAGNGRPATEEPEQQQTALVVAPVPTGECVYRYASGDAGTTVTLNDRVVFEDRLLLPPQVEKLRTDLANAPAGAGLHVEVRPDARFTTSPTPLKKALIALDVLLLGAVLVAARRRWPGRPAEPRAEPRTPARRVHPADAGVVVVTLAWLVLGPLNIDDGWYLQMALAARETGAVGNTVGQYSVAENPFVLWQYLMQVWSANGWSLLWMRVLVGLVGLGTYALLRGAVAVLLGRLADRRRLRRIVWLVAGAHLLWWLPYGVTLRPEPLLVLGSAATLLLAETARRKGSLGILIAAVAVASLSTTVSPSGLVAWAPVLVQTPWALRLLASRSWRERLAAALSACVAAGAAVPVVFADASLGTVLETITVQRYFYPHLTWYDEVLHLAGLFEPSDVAAWGRRLPVFLTFAVGALALAAAGGRRAASGRRPGPAGIEAALVRLAAVTAIGAASLSLSPTKWVNHYGSLAAFGTVLLALAAVRFPLFGARWSTGARLSGAGVIAFACAAAYAGPNLWRPITDWGQPFGEHPSTSGDRDLVREFSPHLGPLFASDIWLWALLGGVVFAVLVRQQLSRRRAASGTGTTLLRLGAGGGVLLMLVVFVVAPLRQAPGWSLAGSNLRAATGGDCGLADSVEIADGKTSGYVPPRQAFGAAPVFVDVKVRAVWPCQRSTVVAAGLAELPTYRILAGEGYRGDTDHIYRSDQRGGVHTVLDREATVVDLPARQRVVGEEQTRFGVIQRVEYALPSGRFDTRPGSRVVAGWERGPTLVPEESAEKERAEERRRDAVEESSRP